MNIEKNIAKYLQVFLAILLLSTTAYLIANKIMSKKNKPELEEGVYVEQSDFIKKHSLREKTFLGSFKPENYADIRSLNYAYLKKIHIKDSIFITKGDLIFTVSSDEIDAELQKAQNIYNSEKEKFNILKASKRKGFEFKKVESDMKIAKADLERVLAKIQIRAPFSGFLGTVNVVEGEFVEPRKVLINMFKSDSGFIWFRVSRRYSNGISQGDFVKVIDDKKNEYDALITEVDCSNECESIVMKAKIEKPCYDIVPNEIVSVKVVISKKDNAIFVPNSSISYESGRAYIYITVNESIFGGKAESEDDFKNAERSVFRAIRYQVNVIQDSGEYTEIEFVDDGVEGFIDKMNSKVITRGNHHNFSKVYVIDNKDKDIASSVKAEEKTEEDSKSPGQNDSNEDDGLKEISGKFNDIDKDDLLTEGSMEFDSILKKENKDKDKKNNIENDLLGDLKDYGFHEGENLKNTYDLPSFDFNSVKGIDKFQVDLINDKTDVYKNIDKDKADAKGEKFNEPVDFSAAAIPSESNGDDIAAATIPSESNGDDIAAAAIPSESNGDDVAAAIPSESNGDDVAAAIPSESNGDSKINITDKNKVLDNCTSEKSDVNDESYSEKDVAKV